MGLTSGYAPQALARSAAAAFVGALVAAGQAADWIPPADSRFSLHLERFDQTPARFDLGLAELRAGPLGSRQEMNSDLHLNLESWSGETTTSRLLEELPRQLEAQRWPVGKGRLQQHLLAEQYRLLSGGTVDAYNPVIGIDVKELARLARSLGQKVERWSMPKGARALRSETLVLHVCETDRSHPESITVLPMTLGWVGDALAARCDDSGACVVEGLPDEDSTLLVRGNGAGLTPFFPGENERFLRLNPTGTLKLIPSPDAAGTTPARVVHLPTGLSVPVIRWLNPGRAEWFEVPATGVPLLLPEAEYAVEWKDSKGQNVRRTIEVQVGSTTVTTLKNDID